MTCAENDDIPTRLRAMAEAGESNPAFSASDLGLLRDAADEIEALKARISDFEDENGKLRADLERLLVMNVKLSRKGLGEAHRSEECDIHAPVNGGQWWVVTSKATGEHLATLSPEQFKDEDEARAIATRVAGMLASLQPTS